MSSLTVMCNLMCADRKSVVHCEIITSILFWCVLNLRLCMKLQEATQTVFNLRYCASFGHVDLIITDVMEDAAGVDLPAGRFPCLEAASWPRADHCQSRGGTPPLRYGRGNTWSQPLPPGSWAEVRAVGRHRLFVFALVIIQRSLAEKWVQAVPLYLIARNHTAPEGCVHKTLPCRLPQLVAKIAKGGGRRDAISVAEKEKQKSLLVTFNRISPNCPGPRLSKASWG